MKCCRTFVSAFLTTLLFASCIDINSAGANERVPINSSNFPDNNFREYVKTFDLDRNGYLSDYELSHVRNIHCENMHIRSVKGIEYFTEIQGLWCLNNQIFNWDLSGNPHLKGIWCSHNNFTSLDFSACPELEWVYCFNCKLESLNIRNNPELAYLECNANPNLKELDLSGNPKLENLFASECGLTSLDLSNNPRMCELAAFKNNLSSIDLSNNPKLKRLDIWYNERLGDVNISNLSDLQYYNCAKNNVTSLDMSHNPELTMLVCSYNPNLTSLDVTENPKLAFLNLECDTSLPSLDISKNPRLYHLYAFGLSGVSTIDIGNNDRLLKTYNTGVEKYEYHLGHVKSWTLDFGGSGDPFDNLMHEFVVDDRVTIVYSPTVPNDDPDSIVNSYAGHLSSEEFATRGQAIQLLYELAGEPYISHGYPNFDDASSSPYADAIRWGKKNNICFGFPNICDDNFQPNEPISRQDFALMAHRFADYLGFGTAFDYGRTDWYEDFFNIDFYAWGPFTWAMQWEVLHPTKIGNQTWGYPRGRMTTAELTESAHKIFNLSDSASYSARVNGNGV